MPSTKRLQDRYAASYTVKVSATAYEPEKPWARQPFDGELGWSLFSDYLMLPLPRKTQELAKRRGLAWTQIETLAAEGHWKARAAYWDDHLAEIRTSTIERVTEETAEEVAKRQLSLTRAMQRLAAAEIAALERAQGPDAMPGTIPARDAMRFAVNGIRLERLIMGESTDRTETIPDVSGLSLEELREARRLQEKAGVR